MYPSTSYFNLKVLFLKKFYLSGYPLASRLNLGASQEACRPRPARPAQFEGSSLLPQAQLCTKRQRQKLQWASRTCLGRSGFVRQMAAAPDASATHSGEEVVVSPVFGSERARSESAAGGVAKSSWWDGIDSSAADLLATKCNSAATVDVAEEAVEPLSFSLSTFVYIFAENLFSPLSLLPQLCTKRQRQKLVGKSYLPPSPHFASDDKLLWALKLTSLGTGSSKVHGLIFGGGWQLMAVIVYCGVTFWEDRPARYFFLLVLLFQLLLRTQW
eukprot:SAG31_NODE_10776_length_1099_cov_1.585000_1_plen_271_part_10